MDVQVAWHVELVVKPGQLEHFRTLTREMVAAARREPGVLSYERFLSADGTVVHIYERYADSSAALEHLRRFREQFANQFAGMVERRRFTVYGVPNQALRGLLNGFGVTYLAPFEGFTHDTEPLGQ